MFGIDVASSHNNAYDDDDDAHQSTKQSIYTQSNDDSLSYGPSEKECNGTKKNKQTNQQWGIYG